jgi:hypothetical protein
LTCLKPFFESSEICTSEVLPEMTRLMSTPSTVDGKAGPAAFAGDGLAAGAAAAGAAGATAAGAAGGAAVGAAGAAAVGAAGAAAAGATAAGVEAESGAEGTGGSEGADAAGALGELTVEVSIDCLGTPGEKQSKIASAWRNRQTGPWLDSYRNSTEARARDQAAGLRTPQPPPASRQPPLRPSPSASRQPILQPGGQPSRRPPRRWRWR